jgi:hypothetical protein
MHSDIDTTTLLTLAQLAVGLIGVSGIVAVFVSRDGLHPADQWRFLALVVNGMIVVSASLFPIWFADFLDDTRSVWRAGSIAALVQAVALLVPLVRYANRHSGALSSTGTMRFAAFLGPLGFVLLMANVVGWPLQPNAALYEATMLCSLVQVAAFFVHLVLYRPAK